MLVQRGTLGVGSVIVAGTTWARVRTLGVSDGGGGTLRAAGPSVPVEVIGWRELPAAGCEVLEAESEVRLPGHTPQFGSAAPTLTLVRHRRIPAPGGRQGGD